MSGLLEKYKTPKQATVVNVKPRSTPEGSRPLLGSQVAQGFAPEQMKAMLNSLNSTSVLNDLAGATYSFNEETPAASATADIFNRPFF